MRGWLVIGLLALAGCGEHRGWNPNYQFGDGAYGRYLTVREVTLMTGRDPVQGVPIALPVLSPTAAEIEGEYPVLPPPTMGIRRVVVGTQAVPLPPEHPEPVEPIAVVPEAVTP